MFSKYFVDKKEDEKEPEILIQNNSFNIDKNFYNLSKNPSNESDLVFRSSSFQDECNFTNILSDQFFLKNIYGNENDEQLNSLDSYSGEKNNEENISKPLNIQFYNQDQAKRILTSQNKKEENNNNPNIFFVNKNNTNINKNKKYRLDYYIKHFKVKFSHWMTDYSNKLINESKFKKKIGKLSLPDSKIFTGNPKIKDNKAFLDFKLKEIFIIEKKNKTHIKNDKEESYHIQEKNKKKIENIENEKFIKENKTKYEELINFLNMTLEEAYEMFYSEKKYSEIFIEDDMTKFYDKYFLYEKGFSLTEKNGFIRLCQGEKLKKD